MMKCSKAKGFISVETVVVIAFLATTLLTVYSAFTTVLDNAKTRIFYDDPIYIEHIIFYHFQKKIIKSLDLSNFNTARVTNMKGMFYGASNLTNYSLPDFDVKSVTTSEAMFAGSKIDTVKMNKSSFNSKANLKYFVNNNGQVMNLTVKTNQDKVLFTKLNLSKLTVNVSTA